MKKPTTSYTAPEVEVLFLETQIPIVLSGDVTIDNPFSNDTETEW